MRKHVPKDTAKIKGDAAGRLKEKLSDLRARITKKRRETARSQGADEKLIKLEETPELKRRRWQKIAAEFRPYDEVRKKIEKMLSADESIRDELTLTLGAEFLRVAERGNAGKLQAFIEEGFPVTYQDTNNGETALHVVAACLARKALRVLLASAECDFLLRDKQGRLPSEMAYLYGRDPAVARLLGNKERQQAAAQGIKLTRRPQTG